MAEKCYSLHSARALIWNSEWCSQAMQERDPEMTQLSSVSKPKSRTADTLDTPKVGLFLVKPTSKSHSIPASEPRIAVRSRSLGLLALAAAALAAPLLWFLHEILVSSR